MNNANEDQPTYVPEMDGGDSIVGKAFMANMLWIPNEFLPYRQVFLRSATVISEDPHSGETKEVPLARQEKNHMVVAKHLWSENELIQRISALEKYEYPKFNWEHVDFGDKIVPRDTAQKAAWDALDKQSNGVLNLACGKGKTVMALKKIASRGVPAIVIVNNSGLIDQWKERALEFLSLSEDDIGIVQGPKAEWDKPLVLAMIHTLANRVKDIPISTRQRFGTVVFDEVHHLSAAKFSLTAPMFFGNRFGLTATPNREDGLEDVYYAHIGGVFYSDLKGEMAAEVYFKRLDTTVKDERKIRDRTGEFSAGKMYKHLGTIKSRNEEIINIAAKALSKGRKLLVLCHSKDHPSELEKLKVADPRMNMYTSGVVSGATSGKDRTGIIKNSDVTFATFQVAKEGLDVSGLDTLIFTTPFKAWGAFQQGKGRIERISEGKKDPIVVVLDDVNIGPAHGMCKSLRRKMLANGVGYKDV
tara:strand:+ start:4053 stop:5471 length:1419 start_codon:yes stop_codon:yes gene_type:complete